MEASTPAAASVWRSAGSWSSASAGASGRSRSTGEAPTSASQSRSARSLGQMLKIAHITLVEDNPGDVLLVRKALQERGIPFELTCFDDREEGLKSLSRQERDEHDII